MWSTLSGVATYYQILDNIWQLPLIKSPCWIIRSYIGELTKVLADGDKVQSCQCIHRAPLHMSGCVSLSLHVYNCLSIHLYPSTPKLSLYSGCPTVPEHSGNLWIALFLVWLRFWSPRNRIDHLLEMNESTTKYWFINVFMYTSTPHISLNIISPYYISCLRFKTNACWVVTTTWGPPGPGWWRWPARSTTASHLSQSSPTWGRSGRWTSHHPPLSRGATTK